MKHECPNCGCKFAEAILSEKPAVDMEIKIESVEPGVIIRQGIGVMPIVKVKFALEDYASRDAFIAMLQS